MSSFNPIEKIVFKKGVFEDLAEFAKYYKKIAIFTSKTPKKLYLPALSCFLNDKNIDFFVCEFNPELEDHENIIRSASKAQNCDLIISFGAGKVTDLTKLVAKSLSVDYVVVPSTISHFGYFTNYAYKTNSMTTEKILLDYPKKVFIDENIIKSSPDKFIFSTCCFIFSFLDTVFTEQVKNLLFSQDNTYTINALKKIINKTEGLLNWLTLKQEVAILNLMDNLIELFTIVDELSCDLAMIDIAVLPQNDNLNSNFSRRALIASNTLLTIYEQFWTSGNIYYKNIPNLEYLIKILQKNGKNYTFFENFIQNYQHLTTNQFFFKAKCIRPKLNASIVLIKNKMSKISKRITNLYSQKEVRTINENNFYENISYVALSSNCFQLNAMLRLGYLNFA